MSKWTRKEALAYLGKNGAVVSHALELHSPDDLEMLVKRVMRLQAQGLVSTDIDMKARLVDGFEFIYSRDAEGWTIRDMFTGKIRVPMPLEKFNWLVENDPKGAYKYLCKLESDAATTEPAYAMALAADGLTRNARYKLIWALGGAALDFMPEETDAIVLDLDHMEAACRFRGVIGTTDRIAETLLKQIGKDTPEFEKAMIAAQGKHVVERYKSFLTLACDLIEESTKDVPEFIKRKADAQKRLHDSRYSRMNTQFARAKAELINPVIGLDDGSEVEDLPTVDQLREIVSKYESDDSAEKVRYEGEIAGLFSDFKGDVTDDFKAVPAPGGSVHDLNTNVGVDGFIAAIQTHYALGGASVIDSDIPAEGTDSTPNDGDPVE